MRIRPERARDHAAIRAVTVAAFQSSSHGHNGEADIVDALRAAGVLTVSLVAEIDEEIVGHGAWSPVAIAEAEGDWYGLGPLSVAPAWQGRGVGQALVREGLRVLGALGPAGCVVVGDPAYYGRFGFENDPALRYGEASPYLQRLVLRGRPPRGEVRYHQAFDA
ncbi:MAG: GNAT family N-acetyltransferase [Caulobacteraceae bacterium]